MKLFQTRCMAILKKLFISNTRTVKVMFSFSFFGFLVLLGASVIQSTTASYVSLVLDTPAIQEGEQFSFDVMAFTHLPVNAVDITLVFDGSVLEVTGVDRGQSVLTIWTEEPVIEENRVVLRGGTFRRGFLGEHKIATIQGKAKKTGQSTIEVKNITLLAGDGSGTPVSTAQTTRSKVTLAVFDKNSELSNSQISVTAMTASDLDGDGTVTLRDVSAFMGAWGNGDFMYDFDGDGKMTFRDFSIILSNAVRN